MALCKKNKDIKNKILITGATSFIGNHLSNHLFRLGKKIKAISRKSFANQINIPCEWIKVDLLKKIDHSMLNDVEIIFHLAAETKDINKMKLVQCQGTLNLLNAAGRAGVKKWIQLSSVGVYGQSHNHNVTENTFPNPTNEYEKTKLASDEIVIKFCNQNKINFTILRPSNVLGPGMKKNSFFTLVKTIQEKKFFYIGKPGAVATYVHVEDLARALTKSLCVSEQSIFNLSSDCPWEEIINKIAQIKGVTRPSLRLPEFPFRIACRALKILPNLPLSEGRLNSLTKRWGYPSEKIRKELGFRFKKPMPEGINKLEQW